MGVGTHIKDRQETGDACNADKSSSQLLITPVRNEKLTICLVLVKTSEESYRGVSAHSPPFTVV